MVGLPAVGNGELDDSGHDEQAKRRVARSQTQHKQYGQNRLAERRGIGHRLRRRKGIFGAEDMQTELVFKQRLSAERQGKPAVPLGEARFPER